MTIEEKISFRDVIWILLLVLNLKVVGSVLVV